MTVNLTAKRVAKLLTKGEPGNHYDGQGLRLEIRGKNAASWSARYQIDGIERWMGLGSAKVFTLAEARERNRKLVRQKIADRIDPVAVRRAERSAQAAAAARAMNLRRGGGALHRRARGRGGVEQSQTRCPVACDAQGLCVAGPRRGLGQ
jgi:hypothetical protein